MKRQRGSYQTCNPPKLKRPKNVIILQLALSMALSHLGLPMQGLCACICRIQDACICRMALPDYSGCSCFPMQGPAVCLCKIHLPAYEASSCLPLQDQVAWLCKIQLPACAGSNGLPGRNQFPSSLGSRVVQGSQIGLWPVYAVGSSFGRRELTKWVNVASPNVSASRNIS